MRKPLSSIDKPCTLLHGKLSLTVGFQIVQLNATRISDAKIHYQGFILAFCLLLATSGSNINYNLGLADCILRTKQ